MNILKNTIFNILGQGLPLIIAILVMPKLVISLGNEKLGILMLFWSVFGYFGFFDFGVSRALIKIISERRAFNEYSQIRNLISQAFFLITSISFLGALVLFFFSNQIINKFLNISQALQFEANLSFNILLCILPITLLTTNLRGVLEAFECFRTTNLLKVVFGAYTYLSPVLVLFFTNSLLWIVIFLIIGRLILFAVHLYYVIKITALKVFFTIPKKQDIYPVINLSSWITVSNIIGPIMVYFDRFFIASMLSTALVSYYVAPFEVISKLLFFANAIVSVIYPSFSALNISNQNKLKEIYYAASKIIITFIFIFSIFFVFFSHEFLFFWLNANYASNSDLILKILSIGIFFNSVSQLPFTLIQAIGKPKITATIHTIEAPLYVFVLWLGIKLYGIVGVPIAWLFRSLIDCVLLGLYAENQILKNQFYANKLYFMLLLSVFFLSMGFLKIALITKMILIFLIFMIYIFLLYKVFFSNDERKIGSEIIVRMKKIVMQNE